MAREFAKAFYNSKLWQDVRESILKRDCYMCQSEGCCNPAEDVHHKISLTPDNINDISVTVNPSNLISLCGDCHKAIHRKEKRKGNKDTGNSILPDIIFNAEGYPSVIQSPPVV